MTHLRLKGLAVFAVFLLLFGIFCTPAPHSYYPDSVDNPDLAIDPAQLSAQAPFPSRSEPIYLSTASPQKSIETAEAAISAASAVPKTDSTKENAQSSFSDGFILRIGHSDIPIGFDTSEKALRKRPGWLNTSSYPGESGVCLLYGHRNRRHLRALEKAAIGDVLTIATSESTTASYTISETYIADSLSEIRVPATETPTLMLITCYPFHYTGSAPQKYVVIAQST